MPVFWRATGAFAVALAALSIGTLSPAGAVDILTSRIDKERTGANLHETILRPSNVNRATFGRLFHYDLNFDGQPGGLIFAQPLFVSNLRIPGKELVNVVLVATTNNFVFAFDADGARPGTDGIVWKRNLGTPPSMDQVWDLGGCSGCTDHNIHGNVGIMSTPVIDRNRGIVFVMARTIDRSQRIAYQLHALDLLTGNERAGSPIEIRGNASGIVFNPVTHNQRPGLALANGQIVIAWGAHEDLMSYYGWVMSYRYENNAFRQTAVFVTTPGGDPGPDCAAQHNVPSRCAHGGIWMTGRAPAIDGSGNVFLFVGNGRNDMTAPASTNFGNSVLKLNPTSLAVIDYFTPENHPYLNEADLDLGGSGPMIIPNSNFIVGGGKQGVMHVWRADNLGRFAPGDPGVVQKFDIGDRHDHADTGEDTPGGAGVGHFVHSKHAGHVMAGPVYWPRRKDTTGALMFHWGENANLTAYKVDPTAAIPISAPIALGPDTQEGHPGGIIALTAHGDDLASGIVWAATYDARGTSVPILGTVGALIKIVDGRLRAYAADGLRPLWTSDDNDPANWSLGSFAKFTPPTVANGRVYMATFSNRLVVYGLFDHKYVRPAGDANLGPILDLLLQDED